MLLNIAVVEDYSNESTSRGSVADISRLIELYVKKNLKSEDVCFNS
jgi:hypothetical protein